MNIKRLILAIAVAFVFIFATDFLIHAVWLAPDYKASAQLWRPEGEMNARFPWLMTAQLLAAITFVIIWATGFAARGTLPLACAYGFLLGLAVQVTTIVTYVVSPLPPDLALKWFCSGLAQAIVLGALTFLIYKPSSAGAHA